LRDKGIEPEIFDYIKSGIDPSELAEILNMTGLPVTDFVRATEPQFKFLSLKGKNPSAFEFAQIAAKHSNLLQRPIVIKGNFAILAQPASNIDKLLIK